MSLRAPQTTETQASCILVGWPQTWKAPETTVCRILMFVRSVGPLVISVSVQCLAFKLGGRANNTFTSASNQGVKHAEQAAARWLFQYIGILSYY